MYKCTSVTTRNTVLQQRHLSQPICDRFTTWRFAAFGGLRDRRAAVRVGHIGERLTRAQQPRLCRSGRLRRAWNGRSSRVPGRKPLKILCGE